MKDEMVCLEPFDWRYSAAIVGLRKYLEWLGVDEEPNLIITEDTLEYNKKYLDKEDFLKFAEYYFKDDMHHIEIENKLKEKNPTEDQINIVNEKMKANTILKNKFKKIKFDGHNQDEIQNIIDQNREEIICETFRNKNNLYKNYCNPNQLFKDKQECCRLNGYYIDMPKKGKSISYAFDKSNYVGNDIPEFDFIPFAFCGERESLFINDNYSVKQLIDTNQQLIDKLREEKEKKTDKYQTARKILFKSIQESSAFIDYDVEVITKNRNRDFFETLYIRKRSIDILSELEVYEPFCFSVQLGKEYYLDVQKEVMDCILNLKDADELIEFFLKRDSEYLVSLLIKLNLLIKERGKNMTKGMTVAYACAKKVAERLPENKRKSYRQRLTSSLALKDYSAFLDILAQLSNYTDIQFDFVYDLFENFEDNKELAYTFANAMTKKSKVQDKQTGGKENE